MLVEPLLDGLSLADDDGGGPGGGGGGPLDDEADCRSDRNAETSLASVALGVVADELPEVSDVKVCRSAASLDSGSVDPAVSPPPVEPDASPPAAVKPFIICTMNADMALDIPLESTEDAEVAALLPAFFCGDASWSAD